MYICMYSIIAVSVQGGKYHVTRRKYLDPKVFKLKTLVVITTTNSINLKSDAKFKHDL